MPLDAVRVDLRYGGQFEESFRAVNPNCTVPVLEPDDGTRITESTAICRYLEELQPEPPLLGADARERALVEMWHRKVEIQGMTAVAEALRNSADRFKDRAVTGPVSYPQIPALAERGRARIGDFFAMLDARLGESRFVAGDRYSNADILALVAVEFAGVVKAAAPESATALKAWHEGVSARPSAVA